MAFFKLWADGQICPGGGAAAAPEGVLPAESQCSPKCRKRSLPDWQHLWPRSESVWVCFTVSAGAAVGGAEGPVSNNPMQVFHSGQPAVGGGNLHAGIEPNHYRHILLLKIMLGTVNMWKNHTASIQQTFDDEQCARPLLFTKFSINSNKHKNRIMTLHTNTAMELFFSLLSEKGWVTTDINC